jgi:predicted DNA-binding transcriptional regulator AlpA
MLTTTIELLRAGLKADPTISPEKRARLLAMLRNGDDEPLKPDAAPIVRQRCIRRNEAARLLAVSLRTVDNLAAAGILKKLKLPGRRRSCGFLESDVLSLIAQTDT